MASIEFINKRIEGKEKEIAKLEKKLERIKKAQASNWEDNPYWYDESDLKSTTRDLDRARKDLEDWQNKLAEEQHKANSRNIPAIIEFLDGWQARVKHFYIISEPEYHTALEEWYRYDREHCEWFNTQRRNSTKEEYDAREKDYREKKKAFHSQWSWFESFCDYKNNLDVERLTKVLKQDADAKYDFIIERTNAIVEEITDASGLSVGDKGDLNGYIIGTKGTAKVQTIGAGGYNIQCFHYRTLIHSVK